MFQCTLSSRLFSTCCEAQHVELQHNYDFFPVYKHESWIPRGGGVGGGTPILKVTGILVGKLKLNSWGRPMWVWFFRAEKRNEHAWTFLPRSPGRVWKNGRISNILLHKNKMLPLITWKEQAICLQKLQAVVITLSLLNFLEEYLIGKQTLMTSISLKCTGHVHA